jgi:hypothetical protein
MKKILLTTFIALGFGFVASAQQEPAKAKQARKPLSTLEARNAAQNAKLEKSKIEADKASLQQASATKTKASAAQRVDAKN